MTLCLSDPETVYYLFQVDRGLPARPAYPRDPEGRAAPSAGRVGMELSSEPLFEPITVALPPPY